MIKEPFLFFHFLIRTVVNLVGKDKAGPKSRDVLHPDFKSPQGKWQHWLPKNNTRLDQVRKNFGNDRKRMEGHGEKTSTNKDDEQEVRRERDRDDSSDEPSPHSSGPCRR